MFNWRIEAPQNLLTIRFDASSHRHLQCLARTSVTVDALSFGQIWFRSVIRVRRTGLLTDRDMRKHLPSSPLCQENNCKTWNSYVKLRHKALVPNSNMKLLCQTQTWSYCKQLPANFRATVYLCTILTGVKGGAWPPGLHACCDIRSALKSVTPNFKEKLSVISK